MKTFYITFQILFSLSFCYAQSTWQEHLSHEYFSRVSNGHLLIDGELIIANWGGAYKIIGNEKPESMLKYPPFMYQRIKSTRTGIDSKELLLLDAFDYDIPGLGFTSLRNNNGVFWGKEQFGYEDFGTDFQSVPDGILSPKEEIHDQAIDHDGNLNILDNGILETISPSPVSGFHEGLDGNFFAIRGDSLFSYIDNELTFVLELPTGYIDLDNDPYNNSLVIKVDNELHWYNFDDFSHINMVLLPPNTYSPQFIESGFFAISILESSYEILEYKYGLTPSFETFYSLPKDEVENFGISSFTVDGDDIYFVGIMKVNGGIRYHYVQKRTIGLPFEPTRQDISIDTFAVNQINEQEWDNYSYTITLRNNGTEPINAFAISSQTLPIFDNSFSYIRKHFDRNLEPNESLTFTDTISIYFKPNQITVKVTGVNYGIDSNPENDSYTADVTSLSNNTVSNLNIEIYPNPTSNLLHIKGDIDRNSEIQIYDLAGQLVKYERVSYDIISLKNITDGIYNVKISDGLDTEVLRFVKY